MLKPVRARGLHADYIGLEKDQCFGYNLKKKRTVFKVFKTLFQNSHEVNMPVYIQYQDCFSLKIVAAKIGDISEP